MASESNIRVIIFSTFIKIFQFLSKHVTASVGEPNLVIKPAGPKGLRAESARAVTGPEILGLKKRSLLGISLVLATTGKSCSMKKVGFSQIHKYQSLMKFWVIFWVKTHFWPKTTFQPTVKTSVSP